MIKALDSSISRLLDFFFFQTNNTKGVSRPRRAGRGGGAHLPWRNIRLGSAPCCPELPDCRAATRLVQEGGGGVTSVITCYFEKLKSLWSKIQLHSEKQSGDAEDRMTAWLVRKKGYSKVHLNRYLLRCC